MNTATFAVLPSALLTLTLLGCERSAPPATQNNQSVSKSVANAPPAAPRWPFASTADSAAASSGFDPSLAMKRNYYVVFDASGSMAESKCSGRETKLAVAKSAFSEFADKLPMDANLGLLVFDGRGIRELIALGPLRPGAAARAIAPIAPSGGTPLAESIRLAYGALTAQGRRQFGYGEFHLVVVTDGEATGENPRDAVNTLLASSPVVLHTIGFCIGQDHSLNQPGRVVYRAADNPAELARGLAEVLAEAPAFDVKSFK